MFCCCNGDCSPLVATQFNSTIVPSGWEQIVGGWASGGTIAGLRYVETSDTHARLIHSAEDTGDPTIVSLAAKVALGDGTSATVHRLLINYVPVVGADPESYVYVDVWADGDCAHSQLGYKYGESEELISEVETFTFSADAWTDVVLCRNGQTLVVTTPNATFSYEAPESPPLPIGVRAGFGTTGTVDGPARFREFEWGHCEDCTGESCDYVGGIQLDDCLYTITGTVELTSGESNHTVAASSSAIYNLGNRGEFHEWVPNIGFMASAYGTEFRLLFDVVGSTGNHYVSVRVESDGIYTQIKDGGGNPVSALSRRMPAAPIFEPSRDPLRDRWISVTVGRAVDYRDNCPVWIGVHSEDGLGGSGIISNIDLLQGASQFYGGTKWGFASGAVPGTLKVKALKNHVFDGGIYTAASTTGDGCLAWNALAPDSTLRGTFQNRQDWQTATVTVPEPDGWNDGIGGVDPTQYPEYCELDALSGTWAITRSVGFTSTRALSCDGDSVQSVLSLASGLITVNDRKWTYTWTRVGSFAESMEYEWTATTQSGPTFPAVPNLIWDSSARITVDLGWTFE